MKIFIDYDTTLVNFITPWLDWVNKKYNRNFTTNEITRWYFLREELGKDADDFWKNEAYNWYLDKEFILPDTVDEMLKYAHAKSALYDGTLREGVVCRTLDGQRSFK